ncbi:uncharacterized protein LOC133711629 [Rosa rugosa]|uniref:uncharacterized protein LOC133711629 n=1 Tax=Rosa rugosa TaxID=74645 RepID=UPI002B40811B|nr:uncharacterized protein LOC133711629 [Rosa rugosa]
MSLDSDFGCHIIPNTIPVKWSPPSVNAILINTDASWQKDTLMCGVAALARNWKGSLIAGKTAKMRAPSPLAAEALAVREAILLAKSFPHMDIIISSDSQTLINSISHNLPASDWKAATIISQVRYLSSTRQFNWSWISRKANKAAHHVASLVNSGKCPSNGVRHPPSSLLEILLYEGLLGPPLV